MKIITKFRLRNCLGNSLGWAIVACMRAATLLILSIGLNALHSLAQSIQGIDPACSAPLRGSAVWVARAKADRLSRQAQRQALKAQAVPQAGLALRWDSENQLPELLLRGVPGQIAQVDTRPAINSGSWKSLLTVNLGADPLDWADFSAKSAPNRFYRITAFADNPPPEEVDDFLLLDHEGKARELFYPSNLKALVVATAGDSAAQVDKVLAALGPLAQSYSPNEVEFWVLLHDPAAKRSDVAARVQSSGRTFAVLLDPEGWGALALRLTRAGEVTVIQPPAFTVMFRGQLDLSSGTLTNQPNLAAALLGVTKGKPFEFLRTPLTGTVLTAAAGQTPSYSREVAPIFHQHCAICHQPNDVAPFAMTNYDTVAGWAPAIKHALLSGDMPPWHVDPSYGQWSNTLALPPAAKSTLLRWVDAGAPRGDGPDPLSELPVPSSFRKWPDDLGPPDAVVTPGEQTIKLFGVEPYRYLFVQSPNPTSVWLRAAMLLPSSPAVVHHYLVWPGKIGNQNKDPDVSSYQGGLTEYVPGMAPFRYPADSGIQLARSNWLTFNLHYTPNGVVTNDLPQLALWYHKTKPLKKYTSDGSFLNDTFKIPAGAADYAVQVPTVTFDHSVRIHRLNPHMHLRGKRMSFEAIYPNGTRETLLSVPDYDFRWQVGYQLSTPKTVPAGTRIVIKGAFDNSAQNLANPDPTASVTWGDQTTREMFVGFIDYAD